MEELFRQAKDASSQLLFASDEQLSDALRSVADAIEAEAAVLLAANADDLARMDRNNPLYDRLQLTPQRLADIAADMRNVATLPSPLGLVLEKRTLSNGLSLRRVSVPFGVIGVVYEARPNVTFDVFSLCLKSGSACVLKGGKDADASNRAAVALIRRVLEKKGLPPNAVILLPPAHEATAALLNAVGYVDLVIPRGGRRLISFVRDTAKVPVIETGAGVVSTYIDREADIKMATDIVLNSKTRRVSVCNSLDCLVVHADMLPFLYRICEPLAAKNVIIYADSRSLTALTGKYPSHLLQPAADDSFGTEFLDYKLAIRTVDSVMEAIRHIALYDSGHSEAVVTENTHTAALFQQLVDAACVYVNAPTSFTDGAQFGLGAEIGISTQKLGARGPMGLREITTYKWLIEGRGQVRS
ncbi:MAG: glutamate-5-semialdehyde dehydrogenase [Prevotella sp.]|nr:glutamate-5-semialdehyde dehydrogenase [Prevotella sp.]